VKEAGETNEVVYTINEGDEWLECKFTDKPLDISNIRVGPNYDSRKFIMYGQRIINGSSQAIIYQLDFEGEFTGPCDDNSFENWSPTDETHHCVMGSKTIYRRRKKGVNCYLGKDYNSFKSSERCPCTTFDYECDHCFYRQDLSSPCSLECKVDGIEPPPPSCTNSSTYYQVSKGYRLVDNNNCTDSTGSSKPKGLVPCPISPSIVPPPFEISSGLTAIPILIVIVVIILAAVGVVWYLFKHNDSFYNFVSYTFGIEDSNRAPLRYTNIEQGQSLADNMDKDEE